MLMMTFQAVDDKQQSSGAAVEPGLNILLERFRTT